MQYLVGIIKSRVKPLVGLTNCKSSTIISRYFTNKPYCVTYKTFLYRVLHVVSVYLVCVPLILICPFSLPSLSLPLP